MEPRSAIGLYDAAQDLLTLVSGNQGVHRPAFDARAVLQAAARARAGDLPGRRRRVRSAHQRLPRAGRRAVRGTPPRAAGEMDERPLGSLPHRLPGAGFRHRGEACARPLRPHARDRDRATSAMSARRRCLCAVQQREPDLPTRLRHSGRACARARRADQHGVDRALSRRRPARGDACHRAADRSGGGEARHRPAGAAPPQPDPPRAVPLSHGGGAHLRRRRFRRQHGARAGHGRLGRLPRAPRGRRRRGRLAGIGLANYIESPVGAPHERVRHRGAADGIVEVRVGTQAIGQGHETTYRAGDGRPARQCRSRASASCRATARASRPVAARIRCARCGLPAR